jgi:hypothetical protein
VEDVSKYIAVICAVAGVGGFLSFILEARNGGIHSVVLVMLLFLSTIEILWFGYVYLYVEVGKFWQYLAQICVLLAATHYFAYCIEGDKAEKNNNV